jgi:glycerol-3-phosphate dehydrogenase (NAD(P)+)
MNGQPFKPIVILGAGSWGTALALYLARRKQMVRIWSIDAQDMAAMSRERTNHRYLPGYDFPDTLEPVADLSTAVQSIDDIVMAVPSVGYRHVLTMLKPLVKPTTRIICATKGMDAETGQFLHQTTQAILGKKQIFAVLSGPSFAQEVAAGLPAALVIASHDVSFVNELTQRFNSKIFRIYPSHDVIGVEMGGVIKNVIAIATGIADGMQLGANARSALITCGLSEIIRLGKALSGQLETFVGLSGMGDLILTCTDNQSRNRRLGLALGQGHDIQAAEQSIGQAVEGKQNAERIVQLAKQLHIDIPLCDTVWQILQGQLTASIAVDKLLSRDIKSEPHD